MRLPLELVMHICDIMAKEDDITTLQSCALLCSQLTRHCQGLLFFHVVLYMRSTSESSIRRLDDILRVHPELGEYIKSLHLIVKRQTFFNDANLRSVLSRCTKVSAFNLVSNGRRLEFRLPDDLRTRILESIVYSPLLVKVAVSGFALPPVTFFARCHDSVTHLEYAAEGYRFDELERSVTVANAKTKFLRTLSTQLSAAWCLLHSKGEDNQAIIDLSQLRVLSLAEMGDEIRIPRLNTILQCAARLEQLSLRLRLGTPPDLDYVSPCSMLIFATGDSGTISGLLNSPLSCLTTLRYINMRLEFPWVSLTQNLPQFRGLFDELRRFPTYNVLEEVNLRLRLVDHRMWAVVTDDWLLFAKIFTKESFPCLKTVHVRTLIGEEESWSAGVAADIATLPFGDLALHFDFTFTLDYDYELYHIECKKTK